jgi:hypothetical protein
MCYFVSHIETMLKAMLHICYSILLEMFNFDSTNLFLFCIVGSTQVYKILISGLLP